MCKNMISVRRKYKCASLRSPVPRKPESLDIQGIDPGNLDSPKRYPVPHDSKKGGNYCN